LSVAEALVGLGVDAHQITLVCSYEPDLASLCAPDAAARWRRFHCVWPPQGSLPLPEDAGRDLGAGEWRRVFLSSDSCPASWISTERMKFLSRNRTSLLKFEGHGRYGESVYRRSAMIAQSGFGPKCEVSTDGFVRYVRIPGKPASANLTDATLRRLADYCAFRSKAFRVGEANASELERMAEFNLQQLGFSASVLLRVVQPVIPDSRMMSHEWVSTPQGDLLKTDGAAHGDDHFYPGPTDIAWDLAGTIVEWQMSAEAAKRFLELYCRRAGDDAEARILPYILAYLVFRIGFCQMAAESSSGPERARLLTQAASYRAQLESRVPSRLRQSA
jgi:hypothetical protein